MRRYELGIRNEELGIRNEELGIMNEELGIMNEELGNMNVELIFILCFCVFLWQKNYIYFTKIFLKG